MSDLVGNPEDLFSHNEAHLSHITRKPFGNDFRSDFDKISMCSQTYGLKFVMIESANNLKRRSTCMVGRLICAIVFRICNIQVFFWRGSLVVDFGGRRHRNLGNILLYAHAIIAFVFDSGRIFCDMSRARRTRNLCSIETFKRMTSALLGG